MELLYQTYQREPGGGLHCVATGQRLVVLSESGGRVFCSYSDAEVTHEFSFALLDADADYGTTALLDWNRNAPRRIVQSYGTWRRLTWFLLDAILVWLIEEKRQQQSVLVLGGWFNGEWLTRGRFQSSWFDGGTGRDRLLEPVRPYAPFSLGVRAPKWRFEPGVEGAREGRILLLEEEEGELALADPAISVAEQLSDVPRFVADDGSMLFFHRIIPLSGPEYSGTMQYGLVADDCGFYFAASYGGISGKPFRLRPAASTACAVIREAVPEYLNSPVLARPPASSWRLHPALREKLYFAGAEAKALFFDRPYEQYPVMRSIEHETSMTFGFNLGAISDAPMSVGLPATRLSSLPRLSTEPDERVRGWFAMRREERRARRWKEFMDWREGALRGDAPVPKQ